jgi:CheY-like chemotaxis protein
MSGQSLRIAIADDEVDMRDFLCKVLPRLGHEVVAVAADGEQLLAECLRAQPDVVITDLKMPRCDGLSAVATLWQTRRVPVIVISAFPQELADCPWAQSPMVTVLVKPIKKADLEPALAWAATARSSAAG